MKPTDFNEIDSYKYLTRKPFIYFKENIRDNYLTNTAQRWRRSCFTLKKMNISILLTMLTGWQQMDY